MAHPLLQRGVVFPEALSEEAQASYLTTVFAVARLLDLRVAGDLRQVSVGRSYCSVPVTAADERVTFLLNPAGSAVACVLGDDPLPPNARFVEVLGADLFSAAGFLPLPVATLEEALANHHLDDLSEEEAAQVRYHRPQRVGEVLFNWFD